VTPFADCGSPHTSVLENQPSKLECEVASSLFTNAHSVRFLMSSPITLDDINNRLSDIETNLDFSQVEVSIDNLGEKIDNLGEKIDALHRELRGIRLILFVAFVLGLPFLLPPLIHSLPIHLK
jgi:hypothetical protein